MARILLNFLIARDGYAVIYASRLSFKVLMLSYELHVYND